MRNILPLMTIATLACLASTPVIAQDFFLSKEQEKAIKAAVKDSVFLHPGAVDGGHYSKPWIDFDGDCGVALSAADEPKPGERTWLVQDVAALGARVVQYPLILKASAKWDTAAQRDMAELTELYNVVKGVANSAQTPIRKVRAAKPLLLRAESISNNLAKRASLNYLGGCGAAPEDTEKVEFKIDPKPKTAVYILDIDFDQCKQVLKDPYDTRQCEAWRRIQSSNALSGSYRYRVTWGDGTVAEQSFSALGTTKKTIEVTK